MDQRGLRKKYGATMAPIEATRAFKRKMPFDHTHKHTESFILLNENTTVLPNGKPCSGSRTHVNTYDGVTGTGFDARKATWDIGDEKKLKKALHVGKPDEYTECQVEECPVAVRVPKVVQSQLDVSEDDGDEDEAEEDIESDVVPAK